MSSRRHIKRALDDGDHRATKVGGLRSDLVFSLCLLLIGIKDGKLVLMVPKGMSTGSGMGSRQCGYWVLGLQSPAEGWSYTKHIGCPSERRGCPNSTEGVRSGDLGGFPALFNFVNHFTYFTS